MMKLLVVWAVVALAACAHARTTAKQQTISPAITSLNDKDAREKARVHPAFSNAGRQAGVEIWRVESFNPVAVPQKDFGKFYKGDSYIILKTTTDKHNNLSWDIHYWIGSETSQDEAGAAAILTVGLDDKFDGKAVQHRETMGYESQQFLGYFPTAIRYLDGGVASGFNHVTTNAGAEKRLFQVKGKKNIRVRQVDPLISSMNKGDVFILDVNQDILVYVGEKAKNVEKLKAISVANQIRDQDHNGRGKVEIIDQYSSDVDVQKFFTSLGSGTKDLVPEDSAGGDDQTFERNEEQSVTLYEVSDNSGSLKVTPLTKPYKQEQLKPQETYILDTISGSIYVWIGKQATKREKSEAMTKAEQYLSAKKYPSWVHIARIPQGTEPAVFKQYFSTWRDVGMSHNRIVRSTDASSSSSESSSEERKIQMYRAINYMNDKYMFEAIDLTQKRMSSNDVVLLDDGTDYVYVWFGKAVPNEVVKSLFIIGDAYKQNKGIPKGKQPVLGIKQGFEPRIFKTYFKKWDVNKFPDETERNEMLKTNEV